MSLLLVIFFSFFDGIARAESFADSVRVLKSAHKLQLIKGGEIVQEFPAALGGNHRGHKMQEGDGKTPEGKYTLDYKKPDSAFYKAIHISYPNSNDIADARSRGVSPGGNIMIHGQKNGLGWFSFVSQQFDWTNGCIALSNEDMDSLWEQVQLGTVIEILP